MTPSSISASWPLSRWRPRSDHCETKHKRRWSFLQNLLQPDHARSRQPRHRMSEIPHARRVASYFIGGLLGMACGMAIMVLGAEWEVTAVTATGIIVTV